MNQLSPVGSNSIDTVIGTLATTKIIQYFELNNVYYGIIFGLIVQFTNQLRTTQDFNLVSMLRDNWFIGVVAMIGYIVFTNVAYLSPFLKWFNRDKEHVSIALHRTRDIDLLNNYMEIFPEFFDNTYSVDYGDPDLICIKFKSEHMMSESIIRADKKYIKLGDKIRFCHKDDNMDDINGYIIWERFSKDVTSKEGDKQIATKVEFKFPIMYIERSRNMNPHEFYDIMQKKVNSHFNDRMKLYNVKLLNNKDGEPCNHVMTMYFGKIKSAEEKEKMYMSPFFHPEKDKLWSIIKRIHFEPDFLRSKGQAPQINLLFHGPPGTGKSSFAYRIAMCLDRHIVSLDLRDLHSRAHMFQVLNNPNINGLTKLPKECIFVFEEFDISIKILYKEMQIREQKIKKWEEKMGDFDVEKYVHDYSMFSSDDEEEENEDNDGNNDDKNKDGDKKKDDGAAEIEAITGIDISGEKKNGKNKITDRSKNKRKRRKFGSSSYVPDLNLDEDKKRFSINDLLEVFQGTVPNDGAIIIATTNNYDEIKTMCPALFRPGRLTPIYFGHIDRGILQEISIFYFGKPLEIYIPDKITVPTSQIIQIALEAVSFSDTMSIDDKFDYFSRSIDEIL